jgi:hypothetical protein
VPLSKRKNEELHSISYDHSLRSSEKAARKPTNSVKKSRCGVIDENPQLHFFEVLDNVRLHNLKLFMDDNDFIKGFMENAFKPDSFRHPSTIPSRVIDH